jgi:capsular exopolysaccharide synthesis family protein
MSRIEEAMQKRAGSEPRHKRREGPAALVQVPDASRSATAVAAPLAERGMVDDHIVSFHHPRSGLTENFKQMRLVIQNMLPEGDNKVLMFTSSFRGEGKTTASLNFAAAVAQDRSRRVLAVDADLREPKVHALLGMPPGRGFGDLVTSDAPVESVVVSTPIPGLSAILCGEVPPNPAELMGSERTLQVFAELKSKYDFVVVDTPPVLPVADTIHMAAYADGVVMIVEAARTSRKKIRRSVHLLNNANASVMGFLLNKTEAGQAEYHTPRYYSDNGN